MAYIKVSGLDFLTGAIQDDTLFYIVQNGESKKITYKELKDFDSIGNLNQLTTTAKSNLVGSINELNNIIGSLGGGFIPESITPSSSAPTVTNGYWAITQPGTYTNFGNVVLPENNFGFIFKNGNSFSIQSVEMPTLSPTGKVEEGNTDAVSGGEVFQAINYPKTGIANDLRARVEVNSVENSINFVYSFFVFYENKRIAANEDQTITVTSNQGVLYITEDGVINQAPNTSVNNIPRDAIIFSGYAKYDDNKLKLTSLNNYILDGVPQSDTYNYNALANNYTGSINFDLNSNKLKLSSTKHFYYRNNRIVPSPEVQEIELNSVSGSINVVYLTLEGVFNSVTSANIGSLPYGAVIVCAYIRNSSNQITVNGIDNYSINGVSKSVSNSIGMLISTEGNIDIVGQTISFSGGNFLIAGNNRYSIPAQSISFSGTPSVIYYTPSNSQLGTAVTSQLANIPADAIIFCGHSGAPKGRRYEFWGLETYRTNGQGKDFLYKLIQRKYLTDFMPINEYYISDSTLSMTTDDSEPLIGSDPNIINNRYEDLLLNNPELFTKEKIATINTSIGDRDITVYTFTPISVDEDNFINAGYATRNDLPHIFINCGLHGSEKTSSICCYNFIEDVINNWQSNKILEYFRFNVKISIIPVSNPSGWVNGTRMNQNGVDLNRNFPYMYIPNSYSSHAETYTGLAALDQPESLAINNWLEAHKKDLLLGIDFHNFFGLNAGGEYACWTEATNIFTNQIGRVVAQRFSRGSRNSSIHFPSDYNVLIAASSYVTHSYGRLAGQMNELLPYGITFEVSQNFVFNPDYKPNDNDAIRIGTEAFVNALNQIVYQVAKDFNSKETLYS